MRQAQGVSRLSEVQLQAITQETLADYEERAESFWEGTRDHDVSQNVEALLSELRVPAPTRILDLGCGPGRDLVDFRSRGHEAIGLDGCESFARMARAHSGCEVWVQDFLAMTLPAGHFDGVFANAALFHVPGQELPRVLEELRRTLRVGGVLFASNPRGSNQEGWQGARYGTYHDLEVWRDLALGAGFREIRHYYRPPGRPRAEQPWLASLWRVPEVP